MNSKEALLASLHGIIEPQPPELPSIWPLLISLLTIFLCALLLYRRWYLLPHRAAQTRRFSAFDAYRLEPLPTALPHYAGWLRQQLHAQTKDPQCLLLYGDALLTRLDQHYKTNYFTRGNGRCFGNALYQVPQNAGQSPASDVFSSEQLANELQQVINGKTPC